MRRSRRPATRQHKHCETCFSRRCKAPIEISVSCVIINCRLFCGAVFHLCKEEEHQLLCPNEKVPCLNVGYGCPFTMCRFKLAQHLETCPASVVCCSMEWNRFPVEDTDTIFYDNILKDPFSGEHLDLSMALRDQKHLCNKLKMKTCFPELMDKAEESSSTELEGAVGGIKPEDGVKASVNQTSNSASTEVEMQELNNVECKALSKTKDAIDTEKYNLWEKTYSKEKGGCKHAASANSHKPANKRKTSSSDLPVLNEKASESQEPKINTSVSDISQTGLAPWQDGVLDRLGKEVNVKDFNMYLVHHGRMLIRFGQMAACTPREKDFVYGNLEPIPVQTLCTFKVPTSYREKRIHRKEPTTKVNTDTKSVDTSDLGVSLENIPKMDEIQMTLLCYAEKELRGHKICETVGIDGHFVDIATQTYNFHSAPFKYNASLSDLTADWSLKLNVQIHTECVTMRHNKASSAFTFLCNHFFRRDEFSSHFKNVHADIQSSLNGWFEQRCPLAYLGCTYSQKRFEPSTQRATFTYNQDISTFALRPEVPASLYEGVKAINPQMKRARNLDALSRLPLEILVHIASFLDSFTLSQLAMVSQLLREVCATLLHERGMVLLKWKKKTYAHGGWHWKSKKVWKYSNLFSRVDRWHFGDVPSMSEHLKLCPFYKIVHKTEPVALTSMRIHQDGEKKHRNLVGILHGDKIH